MNLLWISYLLREFTSKSPSISRIIFEFFILSRILFEFTIFSWIHFECPLFFANQLRILYPFANSLWIHYFVTNSLWIPSLLREFTSNSPSFSRINFEFFIRSRIHFEFTIFSRIYFEFPLFFAHNSLTLSFEFSSLWIHHLFREFTFNLRSHLQFIFFANSQSPLRIHFEFTIFFANSLWIHFFRELTLNSLSIPRIHWKFSLNSIRYEFTICFANSLLIHYLFTMTHDIF